MSGAGEYLDHLYEDLEDMRVLASDGSSAEAFEHALMSRVDVIRVNAVNDRPVFS